jgi:hypothetical protein
MNNKLTVKEPVLIGILRVFIEVVSVIRQGYKLQTPETICVVVVAFYLGT